MMEAQALAGEVGVDTRVALTPTGPEVFFIWRNHETDYTMEDSISYESEEWQVDYVETKLRDLKTAILAARMRKQIAQDVWANKLTETEKACVKEFIREIF